MTKPHLLMQAPGNEDCRTYHVTTDVAQREYAFGNCFSVTDSMPGAMPLALAKVLERTTGVVGGSLERYKITIWKGEAFSWDDVGPYVVAPIITHVFPDLVGGKLAVSAEVCSHEYNRVFRVCDHELVDVNIVRGMPRFDLEYLMKRPFPDDQVAKAIKNQQANDGMRQTLSAV